MESTDFFTSQTESCLLYVIYEITEKLGIPHGNTSDLTFASGTVQHPDDVSTAHVVSCQDESVAHILLIRNIEMGKIDRKQFLYVLSVRVCNM